MKNPYQVLGVAVGTSVDGCKIAWRKLSRLHHPDNGGDSAKFDEIQKAWKAISSGDVNVNQFMRERRSLKHRTLFSFA